MQTSKCASHLKVQSNQAAQLYINRLYLNSYKPLPMIKSEKKTSKNFLNYVNQIPDLPLKQAVKANKPAVILEKPQENMKSQRLPKIVEGDFSKISSTYVLQNDRLRVKSILYKKPSQKMTDEQTKQVPQKEVMENIELIKERTKLQFLEKKGYLKAQQKVRLAQLRKSNTQMLQIPLQQLQVYDQYDSNGHQESEYIDYENQNPNMQQQYLQYPQQQNFGEVPHKAKHMNPNKYYDQQHHGHNSRKTPEQYGQYNMHPQQQFNPQSQYQNQQYY